MDLSDITLGFQDRMKSVAVFAPLIQLQSKSRYKDYPLVSIGFATLLYMLENMLLNKPTTTEGLNLFLQTLLSEKCNMYLSHEQANDFRTVLVTEFLRNDGEQHIFEYFNFEEKKMDSHAFHLIQYENLSIADMKAKKSELKLTTDCIDMLFKTRELYNELQISITQLYFKQQIQKGLFTEALKAIRDIALTIQNEIHKMRELQTDIIRDALGVSKRQELEKQLQSIHDNLERERDTFLSLKALVDEKLESYHKGDLTEKEEEGIDMILLIQRNLSDVISMHESLFTEKQKLQLVMSNSIESLILNAFSVKLNFEREVLYEIVRNQVSLDVIKRIITPILRLRKIPIFNPALSFMEQKRQIRRQEPDEELPEISEELLLRMELEEREREMKRAAMHKSFIQLLVLPLRTREEIRISELLQNIKEENNLLYSEVTNGVDFYSFLVDLHQSDYTEFKRIRPEYYAHIPTIPRNLSMLVEEYPELEFIGHFSFYPTDDTILLENGYRLSDFIIRRGNLYAISKK